MAKSVKKKSAKESSDIFHNIMKASVSGNPPPKPKKIKRSLDKRLNQLGEKLEDEGNKMEGHKKRKQ